MANASECYEIATAIILPPAWRDDSEFVEGKTDVTPIEKMLKSQGEKDN